MSKLFTSIQTTLTSVSSVSEYEGLKLLAEQLPVTEQFAIIDSFIACRNRLAGMGVL